MFSGGALSRLSIFAMGVMPYISASIIIQMMSMVVPSLHGAAQGRRVRPAQDHASTPATAPSCLAVVPVVRRGRARSQKGGMTLITGWPFLLTATITMTTGTLFLMWLGEQITERGIGNGISMIILVGHRRGPAGRGRQHGRAGQHRRDAAGRSRCC